MYLYTKYIVALLILCYLIQSAVYAQPLNSDAQKNHDLEAITITSKAIDENFFIDLILNDKSLYESFTNMKAFSFIAENEIFTFDKQNIEGHIYKKIAHCNSNNNYAQIILDSLDSGKVYKNNGKYRLFTVQMFNYMFENIHSTDFTAHIPNNKKNIFNKELYKAKLKILIFNPGKQITDIPFISSKSEIFKPKLKRLYQSKITKIYYNNQEAYKFEYYIRPEYAKDNSLIIQRLNTIIDKQNSKILSRFIHLKYKNFLFDFDINMNIETTIINNLYLPNKIIYDGSWNILFKKTEKAKFSIHHYNYIKNNSSNPIGFCKQHTNITK